MIKPFFIAHRGLMEGPDPKKENKPSQVKKALKNNFIVEVDVWKIKNNLYLGHDEPTYRIGLNFLKNQKIICHAKNKEALFEFYKNSEYIHFFWHEADDYTLTSTGIIWAHPEEDYNEDCIIHLETLDDFKKLNLKIKQPFAILSKYIKEIQNEYSKLL